MFTCLASNSSIVATCPSVPAASFAFRLCIFVLFFLFVVNVSGEPRQKQGRGLVDLKLEQAPSPVIIIAGRPKAAFLFWFFGDVYDGVFFCCSFSHEMYA